MKKDEIQKIVENFGAKLYDIELEKSGDEHIYRVLIMMDGGVKIEVCEKISRVLSPFFDMNPPTRVQYYLEVSSPGIERKLTKPEHFEYSISETLKLKLLDSTKMVAKLTSVSDSGITVQNDDGSTMEIAFANILKAKTHFVWKS